VKNKITYSENKIKSLIEIKQGYFNILISYHLILKQFRKAFCHKRTKGSGLP